MNEVQTEVPRTVPRLEGRERGESAREERPVGREGRTRPRRRLGG
jgi:hypothetical protein